MRDWIEYLLATVPPEDYSNFALCLPKTIDVLRSIRPIHIGAYVLVEWGRTKTTAPAHAVQIQIDAIAVKRQLKITIDQGGAVRSCAFDEKMVRTESDGEMSLDDVLDASRWCVGQEPIPVTPE